MMTVDEYAKLSRADRLQRLERGPDGVGPVIRSHGDDVLARRPDSKNWAPKEVVCHLRDIEALLITRLTLMVVTNEPKPVGFDPEKTPDRWAKERQYLRNDMVKRWPRSGAGVKRRSRTCEGWRRSNGIGAPSIRHAVA